MFKVKKITFIIGSMGNGGAEKVISVLANDYIIKGWNVDIIVLLENKVCYYLDKKINIVDFSGNTQKRLLRLPYWLKSIRKYIKINNPTVVLSFVARINIITYFASIYTPIKLFVSERNDPKFDGRGRIVDLLTKIIYPKVEGVIFQTNKVNSYFPKLNNSCIIANPISVSEVIKSKEKNVIVNVGRLSKQKNQKMLIKVFSTIANDYPKYILEIYGDGELHDELNNYIVSLDMQDKIFLKGNVKEIHKAICDSKLFVLSSDYEGLSNALLEAMALGLPCISTKCAGAEEFVTHKINGYLVDINDEIAMKNAINEMLEDNIVRQNCGINAKKSSSAFEKEEILKLWHSVIDK